MSVCRHCGEEKGPLFGHVGFCADCYAERQAHQKELRDEGIRNRELLAARIVHPSGKSARYRAANQWRQRPYEFHGHTSGGRDL